MRSMDSKPEPAAPEHGAEEGIRGLLTTKQVLELVEQRSGRRIAPATFRSYVSRGQAPAAAVRIGREPLWQRSAINAWLRERQGTSGRPRSESRRTTVKRRTD